MSFTFSACLKLREANNHGERIKSGGDMYEQHLKFIKWAEQFDIADESIRSRARLDQWVKGLTYPMITLNGDAKMQDNVDTVLNMIQIKEIPQ